MGLAGTPEFVAPRGPAGWRSPAMVLASLSALAFGAWLITDNRMAGMDAGPGSDLGSLGFYTTAWVVMMTAMMFPSISPMLLVYSRVSRDWNQRGDGVAGDTAAFAAGYLAAWTVVGVMAYTLFEALGSLSINAFSWDRGGPYLAGGVIVAAAVYQLTPLKDACLTRCRQPFMFVLTSWQPGRLGALRMGAEHGGWCVGCCWALMAALFALGVMSIAWMVFIAALIAFEKLLPWKRWASRGIAIALVVLGIAVAFAPSHVPGLTLPDSPQATGAMRAMGMPLSSPATPPASAPSCGAMSGRGC